MTKYWLESICIFHISIPNPIADGSTNPLLHYSGLENLTTPTPALPARHQDEEGKLGKGKR